MQSFEQQQNKRDKANIICPGPQNYETVLDFSQNMFTG